MHKWSHNSIYHFSIIIFTNAYIASEFANKWKWIIHHSKLIWIIDNVGLNVVTKWNISQFMKLTTLYHRIFCTYDALSKTIVHWLHNTLHIRNKQIVCNAVWIKLDSLCDNLNQSNFCHADTSYRLCRSCIPCLFKYKYYRLTV